MIVLGVTGGVGAGKSAILNYIKENYNSRIILSDEVAKELMRPGNICHELIYDSFKKYDVFDSNGEIIKPKMAELIFGNEKLLDRMNSIIHPKVKAEIKNIISLEKEMNSLDLIIVESALAIEDKYNSFCDYMVYIYTTENNRIERLKASRGYSDKKIREIMDSQLSENEFRKTCDFVIDNNQTIENTYLNIDNILKDTLGLSATKE